MCVCTLYHFSFTFLQLKESNLEEVAGQTSEVEESAKIFLEELVTDVCKSIEEQKEQYKEMTKDSDIEGKD